MNSHTSLLSVILLSLSLHVSAEPLSGRAHTWEFGLQLVNTSSEDLTGDQGSSIKIDSNVGIGFNGGYHFTNKFALMFDFLGSSPDYQATRILEENGATDTIHAELDVSNFQLKGVYHFLDGDITPYVEAGLGWAWIDSNILEGPPVTGCWWDPWWGHICSTFYDTYSDTRTSYSLGGGLRWDVSTSASVKVGVGLLEVDNKTTEDATLATFKIELSWRTYGAGQ